MEQPGTGCSDDPYQEISSSNKAPSELDKMNDELKKLQQTKNRQKRQEKRLKQEIQDVHGGSEDLIYEKQDKYNYIVNEVAKLQKRYDDEKAEEKDLKRFRDQQGSPKTKLCRKIRDVTKQITSLKTKYRELSTQSKSIANDRDNYFRAVSENQKLRQHHKRTSSQSHIQQNGAENPADHYQAMGVRKSANLIEQSGGNTNNLAQDNNKLAKLVNTRSQAAILSQRISAVVGGAKSPPNQQRNLFKAGGGGTERKMVTSTTSRGLSVADREAGYTRQLKAKDRQIKELRQQVEDTLNQIGLANAEQEKLAYEISLASQVNQQYLLVKREADAKKELIRKQEAERVRFKGVNS